MKVAVLSANIGDIDEIRPLAKQSAGYNFFYYTENTLPFPLPNLDNRMKGKYFKTQAHKFLEHDIFIWIDGSIEVIDSKFIEKCCRLLQNNDVVSSLHAQRNTPYNELTYIIDQMKNGNRYLLKRYAKQPLYKEYEFYKEQKLPKDFPLYNCYFFARLNNQNVNAAFDTWWDIIMRYSNFDQTQFSYAAWKHNLKICTIKTDDLFIRNKHNGYNL